MSGTVSGSFLSLGLGLPSPTSWTATGFSTEAGELLFCSAFWLVIVTGWADWISSTLTSPARMVLLLLMSMIWPGGSDCGNSRGGRGRQNLRWRGQSSAWHSSPQ